MDFTDAKKVFPEAKTEAAFMEGADGDAHLPVQLRFAELARLTPMEYGITRLHAIAALIKMLHVWASGPWRSILTWLERRQSSMMQDRLGPNRANIGPFKAGASPTSWPTR